MKCLPGLRMSIPSAMLQTDHKALPKAESKLRSKKTQLQNKQYCMPSSSTRIKSLATVIPDLQCSQKEIQGEDQLETLCALQILTLR